MIVYVTMKDPDVLEDGLYSAWEAEVKTLMTDLNLTREEAKAVADKRLEKAREFAQEYFKWSEYLTVKIDTDLGIIRVVKAKES